MEQSTQDLFHRNVLSHLLAGAGSTERPKFIAALPILKPRKLESGATPNTYPYSPFTNETSIRVLKILPAVPKRRGPGPFSVDEELRYPVKCCMKVVDLNDNPDYEALSYTWGDPLVFYRYQEDVVLPEEWYKPTYEISIDGHPVLVTPNLFAAMLSRRFIAETILHTSDGPKFAADLEKLHYRPISYIWIDALCINQADLHERAPQVSLMSRIFGAARIVIVWLGGDDEASLDASNTMNALGQIAAYRPELTRTLKTMSMLDPRVYQIMNIRPIEILQWANLFSLLNRSWFKRAWVVQEMALAKNAILSLGVKVYPVGLLLATATFLRETRWTIYLGGLGRACAESDDIEDKIVVDPPRQQLTSDLKKNPFASYFYCRQPMKVWDPRIFDMILNVKAGFGIETAVTKCRPGAAPLPLRQLLFQFRQTEASDLRDKVYAFIGISKEFSNCSPRLPSSGSTIKPNYESPCREVYIDTAKFIINSSGNLDILSQVQDATFRKQQDLPSWVPDFSAEGYPNPIEISFPLPWNASDGFGSFYVSFSPDGSLEVRGSCIGKVKAVAKVDPTSEDMMREISMFLERLPIVSEIPSPPITQRLKDYIKTAHVKNESDRRSRLHRVAALPPEGSPVRVLRQSRLEVFWRTLLTDCFQGYHPAPAICGETIKFMRQIQVNALQKDIVNGLFEGNLSMLSQRGDVVVEDFKLWRQLGSLTPHRYGTWLPCELEFKEIQRASHLVQSGQYNTDQVADAVIKHRDALKASMVGMDEELAVEIKHLIRANNHAKRLFRLSNGHLGAGFKSVRSGDELWILCGASMPFLLRPVGPGRYQLVGETYVHGLMHRAALDSDKSTRLISII